MEIRLPITVQTNLTYIHTTEIQSLKSPQIILDLINLSYIHIMFKQK